MRPHCPSPEPRTSSVTCWLHDPAVSMTTGKIIIIIFLFLLWFYLLLILTWICDTAATVINCVWERLFVFNSSIHLSNNSIQKYFTSAPNRSDKLPSENMWTSAEFEEFLRFVWWHLPIHFAHIWGNLARAIWRESTMTSPDGGPVGTDCHERPRWCRAYSRHWEVFWTTDQLEALKLDELSGGWQPVSVVLNCATRCHLVFI